MFYCGRVSRHVAFGGSYVRTTVLQSSYDMENGFRGIFSDLKSGSWVDIFCVSPYENMQ